MVQSQFSLSWDAYKSSICGGFGSFQQNGDFVDMTLAADGHFVKVHQVLMAMVSPYLKDVLTSTPCQHPVIFLNNVSHKTLCSLLEYVYTGEVLIAADNLQSFVQTAKSLHIKGLEDLSRAGNMAFKMAENYSQFEDPSVCTISGVKSLTVPAEGGSEKINLPAAARKVQLKHDITLFEPKQESNMVSKDEMYNSSDMMDHSAAADSDDNCDLNYTSQTSTQSTGDPKSASSTKLQYSMSIRGSLQVILNRYIYNAHSTHRSGVRRWRCVDYRNNKCLAFVVTKGNVVLNRANLHNHPFHDKKILQKIEKEAVFSALDDVQGYKEKESDKEATVMEDYPIDFAEAMSEVAKKSVEC